MQALSLIYIIILDILPYLNSPYRWNLINFESGYCIKWLKTFKPLFKYKLNISNISDFAFSLFQTHLTTSNLFIQNLTTKILWSNLNGIWSICLHLLNICSYFKYYLTKANHLIQFISIIKLENHNPIINFANHPVFVLSILYRILLKLVHNSCALYNIHDLGYQYWGGTHPQLPMDAATGVHWYYRVCLLFVIKW